MSIEKEATQEQLAQAAALSAYEGDIVTINPKAFLETIEHKKGGLIWAPIESLRAKPGFNVRIHDDSYHAHIRSLADSIRENGLYEDKPLAGIASYDEKNPVIHITDGECRLKAIKMAIAEGATIELVPVVLKDRATNMEDLTVALVRSNDGRRFTPLELSIVAKRLLKYGVPEKTIGHRMGISHEYVVQLLTVCGAPMPIRKMIEQKEVPLAVAVQAIRANGPEEATKVLQAAVADAKERGATGITRKNLPDQIYKKAITKSAPKMISIFQKLHAGPVFASLPDDIKEEISTVLAALQIAKASEGTSGPTEDGAAQTADEAQGKVVTVPAGDQVATS